MHREPNDVIDNVTNDSDLIEINRRLWEAAKAGQFTVVEQMISRGATDFDAGLYCAAVGGHRAIVELLLAKSNTIDLACGLIGAAAGGHIEIVKLMLSMGATNIDDGLWWAINCGHTKLAEFFVLCNKKRILHPGIISINPIILV